MESWQLNREALRDRVAVVAGATRGAGRGIAAALILKGGPPDWNKPIWQVDLHKGLRTLRLAIDNALDYVALPPAASD